VALSAFGGAAQFLNSGAVELTPCQGIPVLVDGGNGVGTKGRVASKAFGDDLTPSEENWGRIEMNGGRRLLSAYAGPHWPRCRGGRFAWSIASGLHGVTATQ